MTMLGNGVEICGNLGPLVLDWTPNHFLLGVQLASGRKKVSLYPCQSCCILGKYPEMALKSLTKTF